MDDPRFESAPQDLGHQYRREITRILKVLGHPEASVTDESLLRDFSWEDKDENWRIEVQSQIGVRLRGRYRLVDIARRMRRLAERQLAAGTPAARHAWVDWLGEREAALLLTLMRAIDEGDAVEHLKAMVDGWRRNALEALAANDYRADVDTYPDHPDARPRRLAGGDPGG